ncbi:hypothetical protein RB653_008487 [Dictyostelium firmibasis]|uniref:Uncharacterized protein n=1 Tax=Dictyostelium firmibasis TaxID=79012 RepID=A0AAN7TSN3_9MYCE
MYMRTKGNTKMRM